MKVRLEGKPAEVRMALECLRQVLTVTDVSKEYPGRFDHSKVRVYIEAEVRR